MAEMIVLVDKDFKAAITSQNLKGKKNLMWEK